MEPDIEKQNENNPLTAVLLSAIFIFVLIATQYGIASESDSDLSTWGHIRIWSTIIWYPILGRIVAGLLLDTVKEIDRIFKTNYYKELKPYAIEIGAAAILTVLLLGLGIIGIIMGWLFEGLYKSK